MDADRFDRLAITLTRPGTRRSLLGLLAALGLTGLRSQEMLARHTPGDCLHNTLPCTTGTQCCSGRCVRKPGTNKKFCRKAQGQGTCTIEFESCAGPGAVCDEDRAGSCFCWVTTRGYSFCGGSNVTCDACETNADCEQLAGGQPGDRCVQCATCVNPVHKGRGCVHACPNRAAV